MPKTSYLIYLSILKIKRFGDVALAGKLNYADLWYVPQSVEKMRMKLALAVVVVVVVVAIIVVVPMSSLTIKKKKKKTKAALLFALLKVHKEKRTSLFTKVT